ncbi:uncharacterized protein LOC106665263 isoform X1 [Cimex lectularius]|uniref:BRCT domain-containing protein n=1 Tax=Cimex lectularius TaxID=79782 RepID=A0A8I6RNU2_CIMLE|nr:uncharacterized protein LOC106665263 isoform X1 [Cimex lectularius]
MMSQANRASSDSFGDSVDRIAVCVKCYKNNELLSTPPCGHFLCPACVTNRRCPECNILIPELYTPYSLRRLINVKNLLKTHQLTGPSNGITITVPSSDKVVQPTKAKQGPNSKGILNRSLDSKSEAKKRKASLDETNYKAPKRKENNKASQTSQGQRLTKNELDNKNKTMLERPQKRRLSFESYDFPVELRKSPRLSGNDEARFYYPKKKKRIIVSTLIGKDTVKAKENSNPVIGQITDDQQMLRSSNRLENLSKKVEKKPEKISNSKKMNKPVKAISTCYQNLSRNIPQTSKLKNSLDIKSVYKECCEKSLNTDGQNGPASYFDFYLERRRIVMEAKYYRKFKLDKCTEVSSINLNNHTGKSTANFFCQMPEIKTFCNKATMAIFPQNCSNLIKNQELNIHYEVSHDGQSHQLISSGLHSKDRESLSGFPKQINNSIYYTMECHDDGSELEYCKKQHKEERIIIVKDSEKFSHNTNLFTENCDSVNEKSCKTEALPSNKMNQVCDPSQSALTNQLIDKYQENQQRENLASAEQEFDECSSNSSTSTDDEKKIALPKPHYQKEQLTGIKALLASRGLDTYSSSSLSENEVFQKTSYESSDDGDEPLARSSSPPNSEDIPYSDLETEDYEREYFSLQSASKKTENVLEKRTEQSDIIDLDSSSDEAEEMKEANTSTKENGNNIETEEKVEFKEVKETLNQPAEPLSTPTSPDPCSEETLKNEEFSEPNQNSGLLQVDIISVNDKQDNEKSKMDENSPQQAESLLQKTPFVEQQSKSRFCPFSKKCPFQFKGPISKTRSTLGRSDLVYINSFQVVQEHERKTDLINIESLLRAQEWGREVENNMSVGVQTEEGLHVGTSKRRNSTPASLLTTGLICQEVTPLTHSEVKKLDDSNIMDMKVVSQRDLIKICDKQKNVKIKRQLEMDFLHAEEGELEMDMQKSDSSVEDEESLISNESQNTDLKTSIAVKPYKGRRVITLMKPSLSIIKKINLNTIPAINKEYLHRFDPRSRPNVKIINDPHEFKRGVYRTTLTFVQTGLEATEKAKVMEFAKMVKGVFSKTCDERTTHLIVSNKDFDKIKTYKLLMAIALRIPIVTIKWIYDCMSCDRLLPTLRYIIQAPGPLSCMESGYREQLFKGFVIHIWDQFKYPQSEEIKALVKLCGAVVIEELSDATDLDMTRVCIVDPESEPDFKYISLCLEYRVIPVNLGWIQDSLLSFTVLPLSEYNEFIDYIDGAIPLT